MQIGNHDLGSRPVMLAPMEDVTDIGFRTLCRKLGAAMVYSEFVSCDALTRQVQRSLDKLAVNPEERPVAIQIYGKDPQAMAEAAKIVESTGLLRNIPLMLEIARAVVHAVDTPVTAKTRLGWDADHIIIPTLALQLQDCGIQALTIHGRTRSQMYQGEAQWDLIGQVKHDERIHIPIIGNGDIDSAEKAKTAFDRYGVDAVMIGRATFGRPWIFKEVHDLLHPDQPLDTSAVIPSQYPPMSVDWKLDVLKEQVRLSVDRIDEYRGILHTRRHLAASPIFKGIPDFRQTRIAILRATTVKELFDLMESTRSLLHRNEGA